MQLLTHQLLFFIVVVVGDAHEGLKSCSTKSSLCGLQQIDKQCVGQQWNEDRDMVAALRRQSSSGRIGDIAQLVRNRQDLGDQIGIDSPLATQSTRHGAGANTRR